jgi:eukaryotic-like serine/threonine-protein kinase
MEDFSDEQRRAIYDLAEAALKIPKLDRLVVQFHSADPEFIREVLELAEDWEQSGDFRTRVGASIGRFELLEYLGAGGAGEVFSARDPDLERTVAIKILNAESAVLRNASSRFIREARTASALNHPNIVTVHEIVRTSSQLAIIVEFVDGAGLREFCREVMPVPSC